MRRRPALGATLASILALTVAACGDDAPEGTPAPSGSSEGDRSIVIGTKNFTEQFILGELYAQALEARGYEVRLRRDIGSTEVIDTAFVGGEIDMYPEYTGVIVAVLAGSGPEPRSEGEAYEQAKAFLETRGATLLEPTPFSDQDAIATREDFAAEHDLRSIPDLARLPSVTIGGRPEFRTRRQGLRGLQDVYGLRNLRFTEVAGERTYEALDAGDVQAASALTTDAALASERYRLLEDPKKLFGFQNAAPVIRRDKLETLGEDFEAIVNRVSGALTDDAMVAMNAAVDIEQQDPATVAEAFLEANDLLG